MKYQYSDSMQITPHFNSAEFRCKCGKKHEFELNPTLVDKLEQLYSTLNCSKIIVTSGYRCPTHDKNVGGSGTGQHTLGNAANVIKLRKSKIVTGNKEPVTIFMNIM